MKRDEPLFIEDHRPDRLELAIRFVCGLIAGLLLAWYLSAKLRIHDTLLMVALFVVVVVGFVWGAMRHGDAFWWGIFGRD